MNKLKALVNYDYLFSIDRLSLHRTDTIAGIIGVVTVVVGVVLSVMMMVQKQHLKKEFLWRLAKPFLFLGITEIIWYGARYEFVSFFGSHFVAFLLILIALIWLATSLRWRMNVYPGLYAAWEKEQLKQKYLSKK